MPDIQLSRPRVVVLGMMTKIPVPGVIWQTIHYLVGFKRLGYDVYYVEAHARAPHNFIDAQDVERGEISGSRKASEFINSVLSRFELGDKWAFHALHHDRSYWGMTEMQVKELYRSADAIINLHGGTLPLPEHTATGRLVYLETDPVAPQIELSQNLPETIDFLDQHCTYFTFAENYGNPDCKLPVSDRYQFRPTRQPVVMDLWEPYAAGPAARFTTIASWNQSGREIEYLGQLYHWSKHLEFMKFLDVPARTEQQFELRLNRLNGDRPMLEEHGWIVRDALDFDIDSYRTYIASSRGEFTVAKDQNVRLRSGWFSDRSATYLASGRPVITQETGFSNVLPTGEGLFGFSSSDEIVAAIAHVNEDYERHSRAALEVAREYFSYDVVLKRLLTDIGL